MLPKRNRLPLQTVLRGARNGSGAVRTSALTLVPRKNGAALNRFGVLVPKKFDKRSSKRNALRRALFHVVRAERLLAPASEMDGTDIAIYVSPRAAQETRDRVIEEFRAAIRGILTPTP
ncbi:MAG: ribonuclease P protein component [Candidatus Liptonbacteria bacterium]|nr:ribonuclease P protein component [Candidatus Liptonbacteria bacterium]